MGDQWFLTKAFCLEIKGNRYSYRVIFVDFESVSVSFSSDFLTK